MRKHHKASPIVPPAPSPPAVPGPAPAAATSFATTPPNNTIPEEAIRLCAYRKWEVAGKPEGDGVPFWIEAEKELKQGK
jgi:hypothetical protein